MNTLDRVIRIIYRELDLRDYVNLDKNICGFNKKNFNFIKQFSLSFNASDKSFKDRIKSKYLEIYAENYNPDEIDGMLNWLEIELIKSGYENYLGIFPYVSDKLIFMRNRELKIDFTDYLEWHGFMNKVDYNIFYAAFLANNNCDNHRHRTYILHDNNSIYSRLKTGIAENHMHIKGSGYTTDMNWFELTLEKPYFVKTLKSFLRDEYKNCPEHILAFQKLKIIRLYLYSIIRDNEKFKEDNYKYMLPFLEAESIEELELLYKGKLYLDEKFIPMNFDQLHFDYIQNFVGKIEDKYGQEKKYILSERIFLEELFKLYINNKLTTFQIYLLNVYILGLNKIKFEFVQDNYEMGFESFKIKEDIKESVINLNGYKNLDIYLTVFDNYYSEKFVKLIEFRIAPKSSVKKYIETINEIDLANEIIYNKHRKFNENLEKIEYGLVVHYIKCKKEFNCFDGIKRKEKSLKLLDEYKAVLDRFFELKDTELSYICNQSKEKKDIDIGYKLSCKCKKRKGIKDSSYYKSKIVGIDTANYELNFRPENFGPIYRGHRELHSEKIDLNFTYHVGEDFNTIANGLRAIDEAIEFLGFKRGDRLGHALALGLNIDNYFNRKRDKLISTIEDYVDDIAWMYKVISKCDKNHSDLLRYLEDEFSKYKNLYLEGTSFQDIDINEYLDAYNLRGDDPDVYLDMLIKDQDFHKYKNNYEKQYTFICNRYNFKINQNNPSHMTSFYNKTAKNLYFNYHFNSKLKNNSKKILMFDIDDRYKKSVKLCQKLLRKKVYEMELKIETNPSSNKKISSINKFIELPLLNFNQYGLSNKTTEYDIPISINTDDSAIFQTNLTSEYSFIVAALVREGYNREEVYDYIEYIGKLSIEHNFIKRN